MTKHLITGGSGFLGRELAKELLDAGHSVRVYDLERHPKLAPEVEFMKGDIRDGIELKKAALGCDVVHHLVGLMPQSRAPRDVMWAVNVEGTKNALDAADSARAKRFVFLSSMEIYGYPERSPFKEDDPMNPINTYGETKLECEKMCGEYHNKRGLEPVCLRPSTIVGPGIREATFEAMLKVLKYSLPMVYPNKGETRFQMTALSDCSSACALAASAPAANVAGLSFNIGADGTPALADQIRELKARTGNHSPVFGVPSKILRPLLLFLYKIGISKLEPDHIALFDTDMVMDCSLAKEKLGWTPKKTNADMIIEAYEAYFRR